MTQEFGVFPFGRPNTVRPMRESVGAVRALVVGVYPSAWHVTWRAPDYLSRLSAPNGRTRTGGVKALAVDVEPTVFWNGDSSMYGADVIAWRESTGFIEGDEPGAHGHIDTLPPAANGSSGKKVEKLYLEPLNIGGTQTAFTDIYPAFVVKHSNGKRREQGDAIQQEYNEIAEALAMPRSSLPTRPPATKLPSLAVDRFGPRVLADMQAADAPLVITLGDEVFQTLMALPQVVAQAPRTAAGAFADSLTDLYDNGYGNRGSLRVNDRSVEWLPLAHPGLLKGKPDPHLVLNRTRRTGAGWNTLHAEWATPD